MSKAKTSAVPGHKEFLADRNKKVDQMFKKLESDEALRKQFQSKPDTVASQFKIVLSDEEVFAIKTMKNVQLSTLKERLKGQGVALFNNNCGCGGFSKKDITVKRDILSSW